MRYLGLLLLMTIAILPFALGQTTLDRALEAQLKRVFPTATAFSPKQTRPLPHFVAYTGSPRTQTVACCRVGTTEVKRHERRYDGPIKMLVGLDTTAHLTGILVTEHDEGYGYF